MVQLVIGNWGWRPAWIMLAVMMFCVGLVPSALVIRRQPEDLGLALDGDPHQTRSDDKPELQRDAQLLPLRAVIRTPAFWLILVSLFLVSTATSGIGLHLVPHLIQQGLTAGAAVERLASCLYPELSRHWYAAS